MRLILLWAVLVIPALACPEKYAHIVTENADVSLQARPVRHFIRVNMTVWERQYKPVGSVLPVRIKTEDESRFFKDTGFIFADGRRIQPSWEWSKNKALRDVWKDRLPDFSPRFIRR